MINTKELGIGNYARSNDVVLQLQIDENLSLKWFVVGSIDFCFTAKQAKDGIKPIKITPEWLERLGFEFVKPLFFLDLDTAQVIVEPHGEMWQVKIILLENQDKLTLTIWYVHQLQNAIALMTGAELTLGGDVCK